MKCAILSIGNEVVEGHIINGNAAYFASTLAQKGVIVNKHLTVIDDENEIIEAINQENEKDFNKIMKKIYKLIEPSKLNIFKENYPYLSERTIYKYYEIAKFYIDEENYKLLLDENYV